MDMFDVYNHTRLGRCGGILPRKFSRCGGILPRKFSRCSEIISEVILGQKQSCQLCMACRVLNLILAVHTCIGKLADIEFP